MKHKSTLSNNRDRAVHNLGPPAQPHINQLGRQSYQLRHMNHRMPTEPISIPTFPQPRPAFFHFTPPSNTTMSTFVDDLDAYIAAFFVDWTPVSTLLAGLIIAFLAYPVLWPEEPDTHPLLLARQAHAAPVRNRNESAVYRSPEVPYGAELRSGLNVKNEGAPRWATGKDGDVRDIWREVLRGGKEMGEGKPAVPKGLILTVLGKEEVVEHDVEDLSREINILGAQWSAAGLKRVAVYLPNSVEFLMTVFACSFYGVTPVLLPYNLPHPKVYELLNAVGADALVCAAGNLPLDGLASSCKTLKQLTWVVEKTSRHMDWNGVPDAAADRLRVNVWHDVVEDKKATASTVMPSDETPGDLISIWQPIDPARKSEIVTFTQQNIVSATAALISALPLRQRFKPGDLVLPADGLTHTYVLCQAFAALYTHTSLAINSVAGPGVDIAIASRAISPTVIIASAETMAATHAKETQMVTSAAQKFGNYSQAQTMSAGRMPTDTLLFKFLAPSTSAAGDAPGKLRLILTSERLNAGCPVLTSTMISDLRIFTRARICYALTAAPVAGAVAQTDVFDYRRDDGDKHAHFGIPLSSVEVKLIGTSDEPLSGTTPSGHLVVAGPAVSGGKVRLAVQGRIRQDCTLAYA
nr:hypothetical protein CFP56_58797 [Quercus suber]